MKLTTVNEVAVAAPRTVATRLPANFGSRLLISLPLMVVAGCCLFGFIGTFDPMPRVVQLSSRAIYFCAGLGSVIGICWLWLRSRQQ